MKIFWRKQLGEGIVRQRVIDDRRLADQGIKSCLRLIVIENLIFYGEVDEEETRMQGVVIGKKFSSSPLLKGMITD